MKHVKLYEERHKTPFKIYGERVIEVIKNQWALHRENKEQERKAKVRNWVVKVFLLSIVVDRSWYLSFKICIIKMNVNIKLLSNFSLKLKENKVVKLLEYSGTMIVMLFSLPSRYFLFVCLVPCFCLHTFISLSDFVSPISIII